MSGGLQSATIEYETPEGTATDTIEDPKRVSDWGETLDVFVRRDGIEVEHSYNEGRLIKAEYEYDFEEETDDPVEESSEGASLESWLIYAAGGFVLGVMVCLLFHDPFGQVGL